MVDLINDIGDLTATPVAAAPMLLTWSGMPNAVEALNAFAGAPER